MLSFPRRHADFLLALLLGTLFIYLPGLGNELVFDDFRLEDGTVFGVYGSLLELKQRMLSYGSFVWLQALFGEDWRTQRLFNLLLHLATSGLVWMLLRGLLTHYAPHTEAPHQASSRTSPQRAAALGSLFFALNPVAVYAVAYLIQRSILMATLFSVATLVMVMRAALSGRPLLWLPGAALAYLCAVLSKEHALLMPLPALALYLMLRRPGRRELLLIGTAALAAFGIGLAFLLQRYSHILGTTFDTQSATFVAELEALDPQVSERIYPLSVINQAWLFLHYGFLWLVPNIQWMSIDLRPAFPLHASSFPHVLGLPLYVLSALGATALMLRYRDLRQLIGFALFIPVVLFLTEFATVWVQDPFVLYRSYLWALGLPILVGLLALQRPARVITALGVVMVVGFSLLALERVQSMRSPFTVWDDAISKMDLDAPANTVGRSRAFLNRGNEHVKRSALDLAAQDYAQAEALGDRSGFPAFHYGSVLQAQGKHAEALAAFERAARGIGMGQLSYLVPFQRAGLLLRLGRHTEAAEHAGKALQHKLPDAQRLHATAILAQSLTQLGKHRDALPHYRTLVSLRPQERGYHISLAMTLHVLGDHAGALAALNALPAAAGKADVHIARAQIYRNTGRPDLALTEARAAWTAEPGSPAVRQLLQRLGVAE